MDIEQLREEFSHDTLAQSAYVMQNVRREIGIEPWLYFDLITAHFDRSNPEASALADEILFNGFFPEVRRQFDLAVESGIIKE